MHLAKRSKIALFHCDSHRQDCHILVQPLQSQGAGL